MPGRLTLQKVMHDCLVQVNVLQLHGTGTSLGDPIEMNAALTVLAGTGRVDTPLAIIAHKASTGHTEPAAGK